MAINELNKNQINEIVIVDNSTDYQNLLSEILIREGYSVRSFEKSEPALQSIREKQPSLVMLDVALPEMDSYEVCRRLKAEKSTRSIPVIFISHTEEKHLMLTGFEVGGADFISKPYQKEEVLARVKTHIGYFLLQLDLKNKNKKLKKEIQKRKQAEQVLTESEERFRTTLYSIGDGVITTDSQGKVKLMNGVAEQLTGWPQAEASGRTLEEVFSIINENTRAQVEIPVRKVLREGAIVGLANHTLLIAKDGTERPIADSGAPIRNQQGEIVGVVLVFRDQTEDRKTEKALRESEEKYRTLIEVSQDALLINQNNQIAYVNDAALKLFGAQKPEELVGKTSLEFFHPDYHDVIKQRITTMLTSGSPIPLSEEKIIQLNGSVLDVEVAATPFTYEGAPAIQVVLRNITERKKLEQEQFRLLDIIENSMNEIYVFDSVSLKFEYVNQGALLNLGYTLAEMKNLTPVDIKPEFTGETFKTAIQPLISGLKKKHIFETIHQRKDGTEYPVEIHLQLHRQDDRSLFFAIINDITLRKQTESVLKESENRLQLSLKVNHASVFENNFETGKATSTPELYEFLGYKSDEIPVLLNDTFKLIHPDDIPVVEKAISDHFSGKTDEYFAEFRILTKSGEWRWIDGRGKVVKRNANGEPVVLLGISRDIHERKLTEEALRESEFFFRESQRAAFVGSYKYDLLTGFWNSSEVLDQIFGIGNEYVRDVQGWEDLIHPDDREMMDHYLKEEVIGKRKPFNKEYRIIRKSDGEISWVNGLGQLNFDGQGNILSLIGTIQSITERKRVEEKIRSQNNRLNAIIQAIPDLIFISDREGNYIEFFNPKGKELLYPGENLLGSNVRDVFDAPTAELHIRKINECLEQKKLTSYEYYGTKDGVQTFFEARIVYLEEDRVLRFVRDITERKKNLETIRGDQQLLRTLIDNLPDPIYVKDHKGRKMVANRADLENIGSLTEAEVLGKTDLELFEGEFGMRGFREDMQVLQTGKAIINREEVFQNKNGTLRWLLTSKVPLFNPNGEINGLVGIGRDITEQKKSIETIQKLSKSIEQSPSSIVITDLRGNIEYVNPKFTEVTGYTTQEAIGKNPRILKSGNTSDEIYRQMWNVLISGEVWRGEFLNRKKNGELYWEWATITSIKNETGAITNFIAIKEDISLRKQMEADLIVAKERAEESDHLKSAFLANMSHEIRTPLNGIIGFSELLRDSDFDLEQKQEFIDHIISNGNNLLNIINDILDISKIESGEISIRKTKIQVHEFLNEIKAQNVLKVEEKQLRFNSDCLVTESIPDLFVLADQNRLMQVFNNLISNALKFTSKGSIQLGCRPMENEVVFHVKDTGIGISPEYHDKVFDRFRQVETSASRRFGGNGLGLAITKNLVELMGGKIWIESEPGKGSTFYFTLPSTE